MCVFLISSDSRTGRWDELLPSEGFNVSGEEFTWSHMSTSGQMRSYCKTLPEQSTSAPTASPTGSTTKSPTMAPTRPPTKSPTMSPTKSPTGTAFDISYVFPEVDTNEFVHGICVLGASDAGATSTDPDLTYTSIPNFQDGTKVWNDRNYVTSGIQGDEMCEGGLYLQPSLHKVSLFVWPCSYRRIMLLLYVVQQSANHFYYHFIVL